MKKSNILRGWLKCIVKRGGTREYICVSVTSKVHNKDGTPETVTHYVPPDRIHPDRQEVLVSVFKYGDDLFVRFPSDSAYKPFKVSKKQIRKAY